MKSRSGILLGVALVLLVGAAWLTARAVRQQRAENTDFPEGTLWICQNAACKAEFVKSLDELARFYESSPETPLPCPKCGQSQTVRALRCPRCARFLPLPGAGLSRPVCSHCNKPIGQP
jgi:hypothetical protein